MNTENGVFDVDLFPNMVLIYDTVEGRTVIRFDEIYPKPPYEKFLYTCSRLFACGHICPSAMSAEAWDRVCVRVRGAIRKFEFEKRKGTHYIEYECAWCDTTQVITSADTGEKLEMVDFRRRNGKELALKWHHPANAEIKKVIFNDPATIVFWDDGTKTVVKCKPGETFSEAAGLALCYMKKYEGNKFHKQLKKWLPKEDKK